jgi:IS5 family transposase
MTAADELLDHAQGRAFIGDTGYDSDALARKIRRRGMKVVICCNPTRKRGRRRLDRRLYRRRYLVETAQTQPINSRCVSPCTGVFSGSFVALALAA